MFHKRQLFFMLLEERNRLYLFRPQAWLWVKEEEKDLPGRGAMWVESRRLKKKQVQVV